MTDPRDLDVRIVHRHVQKGRVTADAYQAHLEALPDLESEAEFVDYERRFEEESEGEVAAPPTVFVEAGAEAAPSAQSADADLAPTPSPPAPAPSAPSGFPTGPDYQPEPGPGSGWGSGSGGGSEGPGGPSF